MAPDTTSDAWLVEVPPSGVVTRRMSFGADQVFFAGLIDVPSVSLMFVEADSRIVPFLQCDWAVTMVQLLTMESTNPSD